MNNVKRYDHIRMEYPELGWTQIQALREKLGQEDRKVVEGLLEKIETLYWELERARLSAKHVVVTEVPDSKVKTIQIERPHVIEMCACSNCQSLRYGT